ncbi:cobyric acid synthase [Leptospira haakeii]|uniref:Cobyric acid synthase n=1 Tax=Leptospira haakeii TaxID=2023198 RepID=A0ABX4PKQ0_9LEPT|nr:cobyric acid synthase [Leptospira haakeii]PKA14968.1 cobyric acid synthase CobQ [Leptospira haakeii]PKA19014.1 cobyric acid synthase CobQ [Leptospira haakeii]
MKSDEVSPHGGNLSRMADIAGVDPEEILDFSSNLNPLGFPDWVRPLINSKISDLIHYPDPNYSKVRISLEKHWNIPKEEIVFGNGASELINILPRIKNFDLGVITQPSYIDYQKSLKLAGLQIQEIQLQKESDFELNYEELIQICKKNPEKQILVLLGHPNNPTGKLLNREKILKIASDHKNSFFVIDESFIDFCPGDISFRNFRSENLAVLWSLTKILALPGLRIGVLLTDPKTASKISKLLPSWSLNSLSASILEKFGEDQEFLSKTKEKIQEWKNIFKKNLEDLNIFRIHDTHTNFFLLEFLDPKTNVSDLENLLLKEFKIGVRNCSNFNGLENNYIRIAIKTPKENEIFIQAVRSVFKKNPKPSKTKKEKPALMLQGTASNVGKSILATAFCRIFTQDGFKVAPFKSQNMALNSFVTYEGAEIGRAQALQAQACKIRADYRMNPILLKPSSEKDSQVILNGKPVEAMDFRDYMKFKLSAFDEVKKSYSSLSEEFDMVILEGAGGVSEVNLKDKDIVNMRMAEYAKAKVLLIGNIDHGGVFGSFVGAMETMSEWERKLVSGFLINRFRGIKSLLDPGIKYLEETTRKNVFGIIPFLNDLRLPEEDSLEFKSGSLNDTSPLGDRVDIVLIDTPRISNHTDLDSLRIEPDVRVRIAQRKDEIGNPDVLILPGSKNVITDLNYLKESGISETILNFHKEGKVEIIGICGGYQMLGESVHDPFQIESNLGSAEGLNLIRIKTVLEKEKLLKQTEGIHIVSGKKVSGYEIHHGNTKETSAKSIFQDISGESLGHQGISERIWGTYLHGVFDEDEFRRSFLDKIRTRKGMKPLVKIQARYELETNLDRLAEEVRNSVNMNWIYKILGLA